MDRDEEKSIEVPAFYQKLGGARDTLYTFDNSPEAWLWKDLLDQREEACSTLPLPSSKCIRSWDLTRLRAKTSTI